jgi:hypothetical protein
MDVRPSDRVRGFVLGRMAYDPTLPASPLQSAGTAEPLSSGASSVGAPGLSDGQMQTGGPHALLDQFWLRFDLSRRVFVTAGKQHVRWGTARFWMPTDYLHLVNRNPVDVFDARPGTSMLKLHLPIESLSWNFYAYAIAEAASQTTDTVSRVAGAFRGEFTLGAAELGLGVFGRRGEKLRLAADLSAGLGPLDVYAEVALRDSSEVDRVRRDSAATLPEAPAPLPWEDPSLVADRQLREAVEILYPSYRTRGMRPQAAVGMTYSHSYNNNDVFTIVGEYFYNGLGYTSAAAYPGLVLPRSRELESPATFFYLGRHYGALSVAFPRPWSLDLHSFTFTTLGNLSDRSFISRIDYSYTLLTYLTFEAFATVHYGKRDGEFRLGVSGLRIGDFELRRAPSLFDLGIALRLAI